MLPIVTYLYRKVFQNVSGRRTIFFIEIYLAYNVILVSGMCVC